MKDNVKKRMCLCGCGWAGHRLERNYTRGSLTRVRVLSPMSGPTPGDLALGEGVPRVFGPEGLMAYVKSTMGLGEMETPLLKGPHTCFHVYWVPGQNRDSAIIWVRPACDSWRITWENRG